MRNPTSKIRPALKSFSGTNALAYFSASSVIKKMSNNIDIRGKKPERKRGKIEVDNLLLDYDGNQVEGEELVGGQEGNWIKRLLNKSHATKLISLKVI